LTSTGKGKGKAKTVTEDADESPLAQDSSSLSEMSDEEVPKAAEVKRKVVPTDVDGKSPPKQNWRKRPAEPAEDALSNGKRRRSTRLAERPSTSRYFDHT